jgi:hypothetical protein
MSYAALWLNGRFVGGWPYGYTSFQLDLTPFVRIGADNVRAIRLNTPPDASRWYRGVPVAALYQNPFVFGEFVWTGIDYLGEPTPYDQDARERLTNLTAPEVATANKRNSSGPAKSRCRRAVPISAFSTLPVSGRTGFIFNRLGPDYPMAHILPHWIWPKRIGQVTAAVARTNRLSISDNSLTQI